MKVLLITNIPTPYRIPLFNIINKEIKDKKGTFKVLFNMSTYKRRLWSIDERDFNFEYTYLEKSSLSTDEKTRFKYNNLIKNILNIKPTHVVSPGFSIATLKLILLKLFIKFDLIVWTGKVENTYFKTSFIKRIYYKIITLFIDRWITYSEHSKLYLISLKVKPIKIHVALNTVDTNFYSLETGKNNINDSVNITFVGDFTPRKNVLEVVNIFSALKDKNKLKLNLLGDGMLKPQLIQLIKEKELHELVELHGFLNKIELKKMYEKTDILIFPTNFDVWGLVINEAMSMGVIVLSSPNAIAAKELIINGENGYLIDLLENEKVISLLEKLISDKQFRKELSKNAILSIQNKASIELSSKKFVKAIIGE